MVYKDRNKRREYQREWVAKRRSTWFSDKSCVWCGATDELELDHISRQDKISHKIWSWSEERRIKELEKCQVLCKTCHRKKTIETDIPSWIGPIYVHGTTSMYVDHECRCTECKAHYTQQNKKWKATYRNK